MKQQGWRGKCKCRFKVTSKTNPRRTIAANLLQQNFRADSLKQTWLREITYTPTTVRPLDSAQGGTDGLKPEPKSGLV